MKIVVDIYGADAGPEVVVRGIAKALSVTSFTPVFVGEKRIIDAVMQEAGIEACQYEVIDTNDYITNYEPPTCIFNGRDNSSIALGYKKLKEDEGCVALLSAGNTGALLIGSVCRLGVLPSIKVPALCSALPCAGEKLVCLVDCGANIDCTVNDFVRFAKMGNVLSKCHCKIENPRVGILSVGREDKKGNALTLEAFQKLSELDLNFVGNLEGSDIVSGYADVIVADGFSGNIILKSTEAAGKKAMEIVSNVAKDNPELAQKINEQLYKTFDFNSQGAATFLGTKKIVLKMHGCANEDTTVASVLQIVRLHESNFIAEMEKALSNK